MKKAPKLLTTANVKIKKGEKLGYRTYGIHLAPSNESGFNVCTSASAGCAASCLNWAGRGAMKSVQKSRIEKTRRFFRDTQGFMDDLVKEIRSAIKSSEKNDMIPVFRLNLTSDIPFEKIKIASEGNKNIFDLFPDVQFMDYTKHKHRITRYLATIAGMKEEDTNEGLLPKNYSLVYSRSEETETNIVKAYVGCGVNVAVVFRNSLPDEWEGMKVVNGDETDLRFLDPQGVVVGLVEKGKAKSDDSGFVVEWGGK